MDSYYLENLRGIAPRRFEILSLLSQEYSQAEVAEIMCVTVGTIKNQLYRATQKLQKSLKSYYRESLV